MTSGGSANVVELLRRAADRLADRPAMIVDLRTHFNQVTFAELWDRVDRTSAGLARGGLAAGERVIVMIPMSIELYVVLLGILKLGAVAVFVDPWIGRRLIADFAAFAQPRAFAGIAKSHLLRLSDRRLRRIPLSLTTGNCWLGLPARTSLSELERSTPDGRIHPVSEVDPALITFTTGSSGLPKGANRTHGFLQAQHQALAAEFPYRDDDVDLSMFPVFALNNLALGIPSVIPRIDFRRVAEASGEQIAAQLHRHGVTTCTASPPLFDRLVEHLGRLAPADRPRLRRILTGGAPVADEQLRRWKEVMPETEIVVVYGSTEAEPVGHLTAEERLAARSDVRPLAPGFCVGRPSELVSAKVIKISKSSISRDSGGLDAHLVGTGEIGELIVAGRHVCRDYYRNPVAVTENKIVDETGTVWHRMGDTGYFDGQGRFWLVGRVHSTIHRAGEMVHPQLVEQAARAADPHIRAVAAVGMPDERLGQKVVTIVSVAPTAAGALVAAVGDRLAAAQLPCDGVVVTNERLPVDPRHNSKIDYPRLTEMLRAGSLQRPVSP